MKRDLLKDRYLLQDLLGEGGMGQVYRAIDTITRETVAVKLLREDGSSDRKILRSLWREVRAAARLNHPNIVQVVDYGQTDADLPFFVMEYVAGHSLEAFRPRLSVRDVIEIADRVLAALAFAHARGVVHRDLKPENIIVLESEDGTLHPKLVDFGVAQIGGLRGSERSTVDPQPLANVIIGTPAYMSPEQAQGLTREIGPESDLYALGVMLYEFIAGRLPFDADNAMAILLKHVSAPIPHLEAPLGVEIPIGLSEIVERLLSKKPHERPAFATDVRRMLRKLDLTQASDTPIQNLETQDGLRVGLDATLESSTLIAEGVAVLTGQALLDATHQVTLDQDEFLKTVFEEDTTDTVRALPRQMGLFGIREVPLVAREAERAELWSTVEQTLEEGNIRVLLLTGPEGIGKSHLARWLSERAEEEGLMHTVGCSIGPNGVLSGNGLRGLVDRHLRTQGLDRDDVRDAVRRRLVTNGHFEEQEIGPLLAFLRPGASPVGRSQAIDVSATVGRVVRAATSRRPVLVFLDDLAGAESSVTIDLLELLVATRGISPMPVTVVVTADIDESGDTIAFEGLSFSDQQRLVELMNDPACSWLQLQPMPLEDIRTLATTVLPISSNLVDIVTGRSFGRPRFAIQLLHHWVQSDELVEIDGLLQLEHASINLRGLPSGVAELLQSRLGRLMTDTSSPQRFREVIGRAALAGRRFEVSVLEQLFEVEGREDLAALLDEVLERMLGEDFWDEVDNGVLQFADAEMVELAANHFVSRPDGIRIHTLLVDIKRALWSDRLGEIHGVLAHHLEQAGLYEAACEEMLAAASQALTWAYYPTARMWFHHVRAIQNHHTLTEAARLADDVDLGLANCALRMGEYDLAGEHVSAVESRHRSDARRNAFAASLLLRAEITLKRGQLDAALERYIEARASFDQIGEPRDVAYALLGQAEVHAMRGMPDRVAPIASAARGIFMALGDDAAAARSLMIEGKAFRLKGRAADALNLYHRAQATFEKAGARHGAMEAELWSNDALMHLGQLDEARVRYEAMFARLAELGDLTMIGAAWRALGRIYRNLGEFEKSRHGYQQALALADRVGDVLHAGRVHNGLGELARQRGDLATAVEHYIAYIEASRECGAITSVAIGTANLGLIYGEMGQWENAVDAFEDAEEHAARVSNKQMRGAFSGCKSRALAELGRFDEAADAMQAALALDQENPITEADFLEAIEVFAERIATANPVAAGSALAIAVERWRQSGDEERAQRVLHLAGQLEITLSASDTSSSQ